MTTKLLIQTLISDSGKGAASTTPGAGGSVGASTGPIRYSGGNGGPGGYINDLNAGAGGGAGGSSAGRNSNGNNGAGGNVNSGTDHSFDGGVQTAAPAGGGVGGRGGHGRTQVSGDVTNEIFGGETGGNPGGGSGGGSATTFPQTSGTLGAAPGRAEIFEVGGAVVTLPDGISTYIVPAGITQITPGCWGGGGGGSTGGQQGGVEAWGGGGGGGAAYAGVALSVQPGQAFEFQVALGSAGPAHGSGGQTTMSIYQTLRQRSHPAVSFDSVAIV